MGRRNRDHIVKVSYWENGILKIEEYTCETLHAALEVARRFDENSAVHIYDILDIVVHSANTHIIDNITEVEILEEITEPETLNIEITEPETLNIEITEPEITKEEIVETSVIKEVAKKAAVKKSVPAKKTAAKKAAVKK